MINFKNVIYEAKFKKMFISVKIDILFSIFEAIPTTLKVKMPNTR